MRKPLSIALCISATLHAGALLLITWDAKRPAPSARPEISVTLGTSDASAREPPQVSEEISTPPADTPAPTTASTEAEEPRSTATAAAPNRASPGTSPPDPADALRGPTAPEPETPPARVEADATPQPVRTVAATLTTAGTSSATVPSAVKPFADRQRRMLDKKVRQWTETYEKLKERGDIVTWRDKGQQYMAHFTAVPADDDMTLDRVVVNVSTEIDGERMTTQMHLKRLAFSSYAQFVNRWDKDVQIHDDELDGRFHANSAINLTYSRDAKPQFHGKVTTAARRINITANRGRARRDEMFLGGLQTGVRSIRLPKNFVPLPQTAQIRDDQVQEFHEDTRITFHDDGSYTWVAYKNGLFERRGHLREPASYLIAAKKATLHVRGAVNGKVLVYSPERIVVADDLVYAGGRTRNAGDDFIGLVSDKTIQVAERKVTGPGDLEIHGALFAKRRFSVARYHDRRDGGTLKIFGSLTAGSISATEPRFATKIHFDPRLEAARPPGFPVTDRYEVESWDAAWTVAGPAKL